MNSFKYSLTFLLQQKADRKKMTPLRCWVRYNNKKVPFQSSLTIAPKDWDHEKQRAPGSSFDKFNSDLKNITKWIDNAWQYITEKHKAFPDEKELKEVCLEF